MQIRLAAAPSGATATLVNEVTAERRDLTSSGDFVVGAVPPGLYGLELAAHDGVITRIDEITVSAANGLELALELPPPHPADLEVIPAQPLAGGPVFVGFGGVGSGPYRVSLAAHNGRAPAWVDIKTVPNDCVVIGRAPISGEYYDSSMPGFRETGYPGRPIVFSGEVVGAYNFDPLPEGAGISGMAWHQVEKYQDPSTEPPDMTLEFIGVDPSSGQLYQILQPAGQPQPPNERPAETAIGINTVSAEGTPLVGSGFGEVAVEADRDIYVAATNAVIKGLRSDGTVPCRSEEHARWPFSRSSCTRIRSS